ncbi:hypothetical protein FDP41_009186 [Naegleria fowleri]|uniref:Uncharacterized protein n=1 Tax=Naegleria fowleri TaxID=5763 RepID=A0A6A5AWN0_NAEFO|nr:uncharacterized protein FDP41_009186 [Naegleria fowleri]KAF0972283.1 hypothetical protein FDP41_009186 [Naegleria fowleri]
MYSQQQQQPLTLLESILQQQQQQQQQASLPANPMNYSPTTRTTTATSSSVLSTLLSQTNTNNNNNHPLNLQQHFVPYQPLPQTSSLTTAPPTPQGQSSLFHSPSVSTETWPSSLMHHLPLMDQNNHSFNHHHHQQISPTTTTTAWMMNSQQQQQQQPSMPILSNLNHQNRNSNHHQQQLSLITLLNSLYHGGDDCSPSKTITSSTLMSTNNQQNHTMSSWEDPATSLMTADFLPLVHPITATSTTPATTSMMSQQQNPESHCSTLDPSASTLLQLLESLLNKQPQCITTTLSSQTSNPFENPASSLHDHHQQVFPPQPSSYSQHTRSTSMSVDHSSLNHGENVASTLDQALGTGYFHQPILSGFSRESSRASPPTIFQDHLDDIIGSMDPNVDINEKLGSFVVVEPVEIKTMPPSINSTHNNSSNNNTLSLSSSLTVTNSGSNSQHSADQFLNPGLNSSFHSYAPGATVTQYKVVETSMDNFLPQEPSINTSASNIFVESNANGVTAVTRSRKSSRKKKTSGTGGRNGDTSGRYLAESASKEVSPTFEYFIYSTMMSEDDSETVPTILKASNDDTDEISLTPQERCLCALLSKSLLSREELSNIFKGLNSTTVRSIISKWLFTKFDAKFPNLSSASQTDLLMKDSASSCIEVECTPMGFTINKGSKPTRLSVFVNDTIKLKIRAFDIENAKIFEGDNLITDSSIFNTNIMFMFIDNYTAEMRSAHYLTGLTPPMNGGVLDTSESATPPDICMDLLSKHSIVQYSERLSSREQQQHSAPNCEVGISIRRDHHYKIKLPPIKEISSSFGFGNTSPNSALNKKISFVQIIESDTQRPVCRSEPFWCRSKSRAEMEKKQNREALQRKSVRSSILVSKQEEENEEEEECDSSKHEESYHNEKKRKQKSSTGHKKKRKQKSSSEFIPDDDEE